jgi:DNA topoisomerase IA
MAKSLVIVESPAKAKTIGKYLGKHYLVKASLGHIKDLPKKDLAVDIEHDFTPKYEVIEGKKKLISELKQAAKSVDSVYLAADPDREGEAICWHLKEELEPKKSQKPAIFRVMFNEITANAVKKAFDKPVAVNIKLVTRSRLCCGTKCAADFLPAAFRLSRYASSWSASERSGPFRSKNIGRSTSRYTRKSRPCSPRA